MVSYIKRTFPQTWLIVVGFSLGGNIVCKYLGENQANQDKVLCCVSVCQGYCAHRPVLIPSTLFCVQRKTRLLFPYCDCVVHYILFVFRAHETFWQWDQCRRIYNFFMADNMKKIILYHQ